MARQRSVVLAGTVSLENYENFRFEFAGEVETQDDAMDQAVFAAQCLLSMAARADPATGQAIRDYVGRVFGLRIEPSQGAPRQVDPAIYESKAPKAPYLPPKEAPPAPEAPASPAPAKPAAPLTAKCERCGAGITASQAKLSQLFMSKTLCKKCMEAP